MKEQLRKLMEACGEDDNLRHAVRKTWVLYHYRCNKWCGYLDPTREQVRQMVARLLK